MPAIVWTECTPGYVCLAVSDAQLLYLYLQDSKRWMTDHESLYGAH